jgi:hypothetical protein
MIYNRLRAVDDLPKPKPIYVWHHPTILDASASPVRYPNPNKFKEVGAYLHTLLVAEGQSWSIMGGC